ncbi:hypothetical protein ANN_04801 [Periplaneta americana]|uniref:Uncharacterized protein n=1 Tax=Periplaneta americana TaxID=6978 RepID=A0ABQ8TAM9_PERAM|nr:hypothetical protein ANN_04801 [Periplaneta americana]
MHATIETRLKNRKIYSSSGYVEACRTARIKPKPYHVESLEYSIFKKYSSLSYITSIRPDNKLKAPVVVDIRCLKYEPDGSIEYKLKFSDTADICQGELRSLQAQTMFSVCKTKEFQDNEVEASSGAENGDTKRRS